jgi:hypothetical protein
VLEREGHAAGVLAERHRGQARSRLPRQELAPQVRDLGAEHAERRRDERRPQVGLGGRGLGEVVVGRAEAAALGGALGATALRALVAIVAPAGGVGAGRTGLELHRAGAGADRRGADRDALAGGGAGAELIGLALEGRVGVDRRALGLRRRGDPALGLLHDVGDLVADQLSTRLGVGLVLAGREVQIRALGRGDRAQIVHRRRLVDADRVEVNAERVLHLRLDRAGQGRAAAGRQRGRHRRRGRPAAAALELHRARALARRAAAVAGGGVALRRGRSTVEQGIPPG